VDRVSAGLAVHAVASALTPRRPTIAALSVNDLISLFLS
jgi:hypothetical protein